MTQMSRAKTTRPIAVLAAALLFGASFAMSGTALAQLPIPAPQDTAAAIRSATPPSSEAPAPMPGGARAATVPQQGDPVAEAAMRIIQRVPNAEKRGLDTIMTVSLRDADLAQAVRLIAEEAGINVVLGKDVAGRVTCNLANISARTAMETILRANGFDFVGQGGVLVVVKQGQQAAFAATPKEATLKIRRQVFYLPYTGNETEFSVSTGSISSDSGSSSGSGSGTVGANVGASSKSKTTEDLVKGMLSPVGKMAAYERGHMLIVEDDEATLAVIAQFIKELWATPPQVFIDTKFIELTLDDSMNLGLYWNTPPTATPDLFTASPQLANPATDTTMFQFGITGANLNVYLQTLATKKKAEIMSNPNVLVVNHRTATIVVGQEIPFLSSTQSQAGSSAINTYEFKEVAVRVEVTPHVADNGMIFMDVHPVVKNVIGYTDAPAQPILSIREALTNVVMQDGTTLVIGGLKGTNINNKRSETPYLARIPLIGLLFQQRNDSTQKAELLFLLTPRLLTPELMKQVIAQNQKLLEPPKEITKDKMMTEMDSETPKSETKKR